MTTQGRIHGTIRVELDGMTFDSRREMRRWCILCLRVKAHEITDLRRQVKIALVGRDGPILTPTGRQMHYVADFTYRDLKAARTVIEDAKGYQTEVFAMKKATLAAQGIRVEVV